MTTAEMAKEFTELLKQGQNEAAAEKYNADDIVSYEAMEGPMAVCNGKEAVKQKGQWWRRTTKFMAARSRAHMSTATSSQCASSLT
nr:SnoaL-like domain-containing protein [Mesorhizobium sp.]